MVSPNVKEMFAAKSLPLPDGYSRALCVNIAGWTYDMLPAPVVRTVKALILDTLGVIGGAAQAPGIAELNTRLSLGKNRRRHRTHWQTALFTAHCRHGQRRCGARAGFR